MASARTNNIAIFQGQSNMTDIPSMNSASAGYAAYKVANGCGRVPGVRLAYLTDCASDYPAVCSTVGDWAILETIESSGDRGFAAWLPASADIFADQPADTNLWTIVTAQGSTDLADDWDPDTVTGYAMWLRANSFIAARTAEIEANAKTPGPTDIVCWGWWQGERDAENISITYQADLQKYFDAVVALHGTDFPFIVVKLGSWQTALDSGGLANVRAAQEAFVTANSQAYLVDTDAYGASTGDNKHADADTQIQVGQAIAAIVKTFHGW